MTAPLTSDPLSVELVVFSLMAFLGGLILLSPEIAIGFSFCVGILGGALFGNLTGFHPILTPIFVGSVAALIAFVLHNHEIPWITAIQNWIRIGSWQPDGITAVQASLGAAFGALIGVREFREDFVRSFSVSGLFFVLIGTGLSTLLIVPLHRLIVGEADQHRSDAATKPAITTYERFKRLAKPATVFLMLYVLEYSSVTVEETIKNSKWSLAVIMFAILTAGIVTYYWTASLHDSNGDTWTAFRRTQLVGAVFALPFSLGVVLPLFGPLVGGLLRQRQIRRLA